ncbi:MAG: SDR family NAD(P)-dependent oxidoreductase [Bacillota bacterium]
MSRREWQGFILVVVSATGFGLMAVTARLAYAGGANVPTLLFLRFALGAAALWALLAARRDLPRLRPRTLVLLALMGLLGYAGQSTLYFSALTRIPASLTAMLLYLYPLLVALLSAVFLHQPLTRWQAVSLVLTLGGLGLMLWQPGTRLAYDPLGVAMGAGAALVYSLYIMAGDRAMDGTSPLHASAVIMTGAAASFLAVGLSRGMLHFSLTPSGWAGVLGLVLLGTLLAILTFLAGLQRLGPTRASIVSALEPVVTVISAWAFLGEALGLRQATGALLALAGALLVQVPPRAARGRHGFQGRTALVTGASSGIGRATALALAQAGATVVALARSASALDELAAAHPGRILPCPGDVTRPESLAAAVDLALSATGRLDILVNNAGVGLDTPVEDMEPDWLRQCLEVNVIGALNAMRAALPVMRKQGEGQIINVASVAGRLPVPYSGGYSASKFALAALGDTLRIENHVHGIQVIQVFPGSTQTPFRQHALGRETVPKPRPRRATPEQVATRILRASLRGEREAYLSLTDWFLSRAPAWWPGLTASIVGWVYRRAERPVANPGATPIAAPTRPLAAKSARAGDGGEV